MISSKSKKRTIDGIEYPRKVPAPDGFPPGWVGIEQAYGENSKYWGQTYVRYSSEDLKYKLVQNARGVFERHCADNGLDLETELAKYEKAKADRQEREKEAAKAEREAKGIAKGQAREDAIAVSREHLGKLEGEVVFGFPGWRCRWDLLPESGQVCKTFTDTDDDEWKLLKDLECKFGTKIMQNGGVVPEDIKMMVEAGKNNTEAHALFHTGTASARESGGSVTLSAYSSEAQVETAEEREQRKTERQAERSKVKKKKLKFYCPAQPSDYKAWDAVLSLPSSAADTTPDIRDAVVLLSSRGFSKKNSLLHVASTGQAEQRYAKALAGLYFLKCKDEDSGRPCYQGVAASSRVPGSVVGLDRYIYWSAHHERWEMGTMKLNKACIAYASDECATPDEAKSWHLLRDDFGRSMTATSSAPSTPSSMAEASAPNKSEHSSNEEVKTSKTTKHEAPKNPEEEAKPSKKAKRDAAKTPEIAAQEKVTAPDEKSATSAASVSSGGSAAASKEVSAVSDSGGGWHTEPIWGYDERSRRGSDLPERPKHWPDNVKIFPGAWATWLPSDWGQCRMANSFGEDRTKFVSPEGLICHTKAEVEKKVGRELQGDELKDWPDWLPKDWFRSQMPRSTDGQLMNIFICPDKTRFLRQMREVQKCIADGTVGKRGAFLNVRPDS